MDAISYERATDVGAAIKAAQQPGVTFILFSSVNPNE